jgi:hypothetical protein
MDPALEVEVSSPPPSGKTFAHLPEAVVKTDSRIFISNYAWYPSQQRVSEMRAKEDQGNTDLIPREIFVC